MRRGFKHLTLTKRLQIESYLKINLPVREIAKLIGVTDSTVYREIKRGQFVHKSKRLDYVDYKFYFTTKYSPDIAQRRYEDNLRNKGAEIKLGKDFRLATYIENRIVNDHLSPQAVLGEIKCNNLHFQTSISVNTLYSYIRKGIFLNLQMKHLMFGERKKRRNCVSVVKRPPRGPSIEMRPKEISYRNSFGHWEMDCVCGSSKSCLLVLTERLTRYEIIYRMQNQTSKSVLQCLNKLERSFGKRFRKVFKSITVDNGSEFADYNGITKSIFKGKRTSCYYCHPYSSYERGTNERINREIRRLLPKGTDIAKISDSQVACVCKWVNNYPRQVLNYKTSQTLFEQQLQCLA